MDTRSKIVAAADADFSRSISCAAVLASFDVLTGERIARLREISAEHGALAAVVTQDPDCLLTLKARAELAAALDIIDVVIMADEPVETLMPRLRQSFVVVDERERDAAISQRLVEHIRDKNGIPVT